MDKFLSALAAMGVIAGLFIFGAALFVISIISGLLVLGYGVYLVIQDDKEYNLKKEKELQANHPVSKDSD